MLNIIENSNILLKIKSVFEREFKPDIYSNWISKLSLIKICNNRVQFSVPTSFIKNYIIREYLGTVKRRGLKQILKENFDIDDIDIIVNKEQNTEILYENNVESISKNNNLYNIGTDLKTEYKFENFITNETNELAFNTAKSIVETNGIFNPLFIYGSVGVGKTHLIQSIAWEMKDKYKDKNIVYLSAEKFIHLYTSAVSTRNIEDINKFKERFKNIDVLVVDDIQFIIGKEKTEKEFFYTFNILLGENKTIIIACDKYPDKMDLDELFRSRLKSGIVVNIIEPDYKLKFDIAKKKASLFNLNCEDSIFECIAKGHDIVNGRDIESIIKKLLIEQNFLKKHITIDTINSMLSEARKNIDISLIQQKVSEFYKITRDELLSNKRNSRFILPRQIAYYLSKKFTNKNYTEISSNFNRTHAMIVLANEKIKNEIDKKNYDIINSIKEIEKML